MRVEIFEPDGRIRDRKLVAGHAAEIHVQVLDFEAQVAGHHVLDAATEDGASEAIGHGGLVARLGGLLTSLAVEPGEAAFAVDERVLHDGEAQAAGRHGVEATIYPDALIVRRSARRDAAIAIQTHVAAVELEARDEGAELVIVTGLKAADPSRVVVAEGTGRHATVSVSHVYAAPAGADVGAEIEAGPSWWSLSGRAGKRAEQSSRKNSDDAPHMDPPTIRTSPM